MLELPITVTVDDAKNPTLLVRLLRTFADQINTLGTRIDALLNSIKIPSIASIRNALQSDGAFPLNLTNLRGVVADPQPASALRYDTAPTGLALQGLRDTQFVLVKNGTGYDLCTVVGGNPNSLFTLIAGASGGGSMTTDTAQTVTGAKTFNAGTLKLAGSGGTSQVLKQTTAGGVVTVAQLAAADLSDYVEWTSWTPTRTAATGTWTAGTESGRYKIVGKTLYIQYSISSSTLSAATTSIAISLPASKALAQGFRTLILVQDSGTFKTGIISTGGTGTTILSLYPSVASGSWTGGVTNNDVYILAAFEIQ